MNITVKSVLPYDKWDENLAGFSGSLFLSRVWIESVSDPYKGRQPVFLHFLSENKVIAMLAGIDIPVRKGNGRQLLFYSGIAISGDQRKSLEAPCRNALYHYAVQSGFARLTLKSYDHHHYGKKPRGGERKKFYLYPRAEYYFNLSMGKDEILGRFKPDLRRRARKAGREGLTFRTTQDPSMTKELLTLIKETYNRRSSKGYGHYNHFFLPLFHEEEIEHMLRSEAALLFVAEYQGKPVSIQFLFAHQRKAYGIFMGTHPMGYKQNAPALLYVKGTEYMCEKGFEYYNLGGVQTSQRGLKMFKDTMGANRMESCEETTKFLQYPYKLWNPMLAAIEQTKNVRFIPWRLKKPLIRFYEFLLNGRHKH